jgi:RND family efflux transporter MFP subunit
MARTLTRSAVQRKRRIEILNQPPSVHPELVEGLSFASCRRMRPQEKAVLRQAQDRRFGADLRRAALATFAALAACSSAPERTAPPFVLVATAQPATADASRLNGVVAARTEASLGFRVGGPIVRRYVDPGQAVSAGTPLMQLDPRDLALGASARTRAVEAAAASLDMATREEARARALAAVGIAARKDFEDAQARLQATRAQWLAAQAEAREAGNALGYAVLRADAPGVVSEILAQPGDVVAAGQPVIRFARNGPREAAIAVPEDRRATIPRLASAEVYGVPGLNPARLREIAATTDPATRTYAARYVLSGAAAAAPLGATVRLLLETSGAPAVSVPIGALYGADGSSAVWVVTGANPVVRSRRVHVARLGEEDAVIDSGLKPGEQVVALGAHLLHDGDQVRIKP